MMKKNRREGDKNATIKYEEMYRKTEPVAGLKEEGTMIRHRAAVVVTTMNLTVVHDVDRIGDLDAGMVVDPVAVDLIAGTIRVLVQTEGAEVVDVGNVLSVQKVQIGG